MPDTKVTDEAAASALTGAELVRGVQAGGVVKMTVDQINALLQSGTGAVTRTLAGRLRDTSSALDYGTTASKINQWLTYIASVGGTHFWPFGDYTTSTQLVLDVTGISRSLDVFCAGATITTTGAISGFKITGSSNPHPVTIYSLTVDHRGNANATAGFEQSRTSYVRWPGCLVKANSSVQASYKAWYLHQTDVNDTTTACFWTDFNGARIYSSSGQIPIGVLLEGQCNATNFYGMSFSSCNDCIKLISNPAGTYALANSTMVVGARFETFTNAVRVIGSAGQQTAEGLVISHCRFEDAGSNSYVLSLEAATVSAYNSPFIGFNELIAATGTANIIVNNPQGLRVNKLELRETAAAEDFLFTGHGLRVGSADATNDSFIVAIPNTGSGQRWEDSAAGAIATLHWTASGKVELKAASGYKIYHGLASGISGTTTRAENLRGDATFASAATKAVTFATAEPDATYYLAIAGNKNETFWVTAIGTGGFTLNSSNAASVATVSWHLIR